MTNTNRKVNSDQDNDGRDSECAQAAEAEAPRSADVGGGALSVAGDNWAVEYKEGVGNHVLATRDIEPNEVNNEQMRERLMCDLCDILMSILQVILTDCPAVLGPNYETEAVCLECLSR